MLNLHRKTGIVPEILDSESQPGSRVQVNASLTGKLNLADYPNAVPALFPSPAIRAFSSRSRGTSMPSGGPRKTGHIENLDLQLDGPLLARVNETEFARVSFEIRAGQRGEFADFQMRARFRTPAAESLGRPVAFARDGGRPSFRRMMPQSRCC